MNSTVSNKKALDIQLQECTSLIDESKDRYIADILLRSLPLKLIFKSLINEGVFPSFIKDCKKSNVVPIHKKESQNFITSYQPINLLQIFRKAFERLVFNVL